jgi:hypothetical protein
MQRVTRYSLLLRQILHYTNKKHAEHESILAALLRSDEFLAMINDHAQTVQTNDRLRKMQKEIDLDLEGRMKLDLFAPTKSGKKRILLYECVLYKQKSGKKLVTFLFNDFVLLVLDHKGMKQEMYKLPILLDELEVKDDESGNSGCFQLISAKEGTIAVRAESVAEKKLIVNKMIAAIKNYEQPYISTNEAVSRQSIGTLKVTLVGLKGLDNAGIFAIIELDNQMTRSRSSQRWKQSLMFSVPCLDQVLKITLYKEDAYSKDVYIGHAELSLDFLEYYNGRETERMEISLIDSPQSLLILQLMYRPL